MNTEERDHTARLLQLHTAHLRDLELKAATYGNLDVPTHITLQITEYREKIAELEGRMQAQLPLHNLPPRDYEQFVGRQKELVDVQKLLLPYPRSRAYVITIDGIGGIGKSALALETAYHFRDQYVSLPETERFEAIVWVSAKRSYLTANGILERHQAFRTLDDLYAAIAQVLDYPAITRARAEEQRAIVEDVLREQRTLLILDNLETVDDEELLSFLHELPDPAKAIVTTRHRIDVARPIRLTGMPHTDALALIAQETGRKDVILSADEQEQLWQRTGGVPLAIVWSIGLMGLGGSVESVLRRLGSGQSDIARFCFEESVAQIRGRDAHSLLLALSLFATDASREAIGIVAGLGEDAFGRDMGLEELLRLSLVNKEGDRFSLLPLTRAYIEDNSVSSKNWQQETYPRWIYYYKQLLETFWGNFANWEKISQFEKELSNSFALLDYLAKGIRFGEDDQGRIVIKDDSKENIQLFVDFSDIVARIARIRGYWSDCERISSYSVQISQAISQRKAGWHNQNIAWINYNRGDLSLAKQAAQEALEQGQKSDRYVLEGEAKMLLGLISLRENRYEEAEQTLQEALNSFPFERQSTVIPNFWGSLGLLSETIGTWDKAEAWYRQSIIEFKKTDYFPELSQSLLGLGRVYVHNNNFEDASISYIEGLTYARICGRADLLAQLHRQIAALDQIYLKGDSAKDHARQAIDLFRRLGMKREQAEAEALLAQLQNA